MHLLPAPTMGSSAGNVAYCQVRLRSQKTSIQLLPTTIDSYRGKHSFDVIAQCNNSFTSLDRGNLSPIEWKTTNSLHLPVKSSRSKTFTLIYATEISLKIQFLPC